MSYARLSGLISQHLETGQLDISWYFDCESQSISKS